MVKRILAVLFVIVALGTVTSALAATSAAQPVTSIATYNDFGQQIRLQWSPTKGAASYNVYLAPGYNAADGFTLQHNVVKNSYNYIQVSRYQWVIQDYVQAPTMGWYTVRITAVDAAGVESAPYSVSVSVIR